jgi:hypothetical protein
MKLRAIIAMAAMSALAACAATPHAGAPSAASTSS